MDPPSIIDPTFHFTVDVTLANVTSLWCWEYKLKWNSTIIKLVSRVIHAPAGWTGWVWDDVGEDYHWYGYSAIYPNPPFTGSLSLCTYTFQLFDVGNCTLDLYDTILAGPDPDTDIPHAVEDGYFENQPNPFPWDVNRDGKVNVVDVAIIGKAFGSEPGDPNWIPIVDIYEDGKINIVDVAVVGKHFGESV